MDRGKQGILRKRRLVTSILNRDNQPNRENQPNRDNQYSTGTINSIAECTASARCIGIDEKEGREILLLFLPERPGPLGQAQGKFPLSLDSFSIVPTLLNDSKIHIEEVGNV